LIADLILDRPNPWETLYDPARKSLRGSSEFLRENVNVAVQYREYLARGDVRSTDEIRKGQGAVLREGLKLVAVFRDKNGVLHKRSAVCPHLGCIVKWNDVEATWDCPCHGSRFTALGEVVNGPALSGLDKAS
jgi:Rieske Fe-S protein